MPPYPLTVQVRLLVFRSTTVAWRWPAPESPGCRLPARSPVWQRPALPPEVVDPVAPVAVEPLVTGAVEEDDDAHVLVDEREGDEPPPASEIAPRNELPATAASASAGRRSLECLTAPTLESRCDRGPDVLFRFRDIMRRIEHGGEGAEAVPVRRRDRRAALLPGVPVRRHAPGGAERHHAAQIVEPNRIIGGSWSDST